MAIKTALRAKHIVLILGSLVIIGAVVVVVILLLRQPPEIVPDVIETEVINAENVTDIGKKIEGKVAKGMFETHMNTTWTFPDGKSPSIDAVMGNSANNNYPFYFTVTLADTGETVFTSGLLPVGSQISEIVLEENLAAGTYPAVVSISMVDDDGNVMENNMGINVTLIIKS